MNNVTRVQRGQTSPLSTLDYSFPHACTQNPCLIGYMVIQISALTANVRRPELLAI